MCLVVLFFRVAEDAPVIVGANREEDYARPGEPPQLLAGPCRIAAGLDPRGGGTWLGVNEHGGLVAVKELCALPGGEAPDVCIHGKDRGTVSSSLLALRQPLSESVYLHAQGPPDRAPYEDYSHLLRQLRG